MEQSIEKPHNFFSKIPDDNPDESTGKIKKIKKVWHEFQCWIRKHLIKFYKKITSGHYDYEKKIANTQDLCIQINEARSRLQDGKKSYDEKKNENAKKSENTKESVNLSRYGSGSTADTERSDESENLDEITIMENNESHEKIINELNILLRDMHNKKTVDLQQFSKYALDSLEIKDIDKIIDDKNYTGFFSYNLGMQCVELAKQKYSDADDQRMLYDISKKALNQCVTLLPIDEEKRLKCVCDTLAKITDNVFEISYQFHSHITCLRLKAKEKYDQFSNQDSEIIHREACIMEFAQHLIRSWELLASYHEWEPKIKNGKHGDPVVTFTPVSRFDYAMSKTDFEEELKIFQALWESDVPEKDKQEYSFKAIKAWLEQADFYMKIHKNEIPFQRANKETLESYARILYGNAMSLYQTVCSGIVSRKE